MTTLLNNSIKGRKFVAAEILNEFSIIASASPEAFERKRQYLAVPASTCIVFVDVLRASTTINAVLAAGGRGVRFLPKPLDRAYDFSPVDPLVPGTWVTGGEEDGRPIPGGVIGNSPLSIQQSDLDGKYLRFYSSNGARAMHAATAGAEFGAIYMCSMANIDATVSEIAGSGFERVCVVCGGFYSTASLEDIVAAGRFIARLSGMSESRWHTLDDESQMMLLASERFDLDDLALVLELTKGQVARILAIVGRTDDIDACITGDGMGALWKEMSRTVVKVDRVGGESILTGRKVSYEI